jgi:hypothetical protein
MIVCDGVKVECTYAKLVELAIVLMHNLVLLSTLIAVALFAYAGFRMLLAQGSENEYKKAIEMFKKLAIGYMWILAAWLVVYTISSALLNPGFSLLGS